MIDLKLIWDFVSQHYLTFTFLGVPITLLIPLGRQWIRSSFACKETEIVADRKYKETVAKANAQVEIERIRAGISERPKPYNSNLRIDKDSS